MQEDGVINGFHHCFNHNVQNVIKDAIKTTPGMEKTLETFRQNAAIFSRSKNERHAFKKVCETNNFPPLIPPVPNETRWFGDLAMLEAFLRVEEGIKFHAIKSTKMVSISAIDWKNARGYVDILKPFHCATKIEEGESMSLFLPSYPS